MYDLVFGTGGFLLRSPKSDYLSVGVLYHNIIAIGNVCPYEGKYSFPVTFTGPVGQETIHMPPKTRADTVQNREKLWSKQTESLERFMGTMGDYLNC